MTFFRRSFLRPLATVPRRWRPFARHLIRYASSKSPPEKAVSSQGPLQRPKATSTRPPQRPQAWKYRLPFLGALRYILAFAIIAHIFWTHFYSWSFTEGISMLPTMQAAGGSVIISKMYRRGKKIQVGDLVSFANPVFTGMDSIKRVIGLEGDWVCRDTPGVGKGIMVQIPQGHCWVVGDNLAHSRDSRMFGPLPMALIKGKVIAQSGNRFDFHWIENGLRPAEEDDLD